MSDRHASLLVCVCVMCFSVCMSVVSCRKIAHTLASSCDLFPIDSLIVFVHAHMHICVCVNIWTIFYLCIFMCVCFMCARLYNNVDNISTFQKPFAAGRTH